MTVADLIAALSEYDPEAGVDIDLGEAAPSQGPSGTCAVSVAPDPDGTVVIFGPRAGD